MSNEHLHIAKKIKNDEFYTSLNDIQNEINSYLGYDPDCFRDKTVLLPCDDPDWSCFTKYFIANFEYLGLKKLIATSYAYDKKTEKYGMLDFLIEDEKILNSEQFNPRYEKQHGKKFVMERGKSNNLKWEYLNGDGDFQSLEVCELRDEADIIVTNPPFSLFRTFLVDWIMSADKKFLIIGNKNAIECKDIFPLIKNNKIWFGTSIPNKFTTPDDPDYKNNKVQGLTRWYTNLPHKKKNEPLSLSTKECVEKRHKDIKTLYQKYDNYEAIEVPKVTYIPSDYDGFMGVPVTFLDYYCPDQFEIIGLACGNGRANHLYYEVPYTPNKNDRGGNPLLNGIRKYARLLIKRKK